MNNTWDLSKRILDCIDAEFDDEKLNDLYDELSQVPNGIIKDSFVKLCERIERHVRNSNFVSKYKA